MACLKASKLEVFTMDGHGTITGRTSVVTDRGRLRTPVLGPDGALYVTTSNGAGNDRILRVAPA